MGDADNWKIFGKFCLTLAVAEAPWRKFSDRLSLQARSLGSGAVIDMFFE
jgi:hypothetical protein